MYHFGIIGKPLEHSFSARYFADKFQREQVDAEYLLCPVADASLIGKAMDQFDGFNVTYPYKEAILLHLPELDKVAHEIGAVNVVCHQKGYNTDWIGFAQSLRPLLTTNDRRALLLGSGGVSKAVQYALRQMDIPYTVVSREAKKGQIGYEQVDEILLKQYQIIVNCTPLGMYPDIEGYPSIPYHALSHEHLLFDCVYNPEKTQFLLLGEKYGARVVNGLQMLYLQADAAWEIWKNELKINESTEYKTINT